MLDPEFLGDLPDSVVDMWHAVETDLLCDIAKRINNSNYLIPTSTWNLNKLKDLGLHQDYINEKLSQATKKSKEEIEKIMANAFREGLRHDNEIIKKGLGKLDDIVINAKAFNPIASAGIKAVNNEIKNFTKTYAARLSQKYEWSIDKAFLNVQSGYMTPEQATKRAIEELFLHNDLPDLVTQKGRHEQLSTVVARAIRTGTNQSMAKIQIENCKDLDCDLVEVSSHYGARPSHAEWQGQIYSLSGKHDKYADFVKSTGYGGVDGLCGINCRHSFYPYFEGLSTKSFERIDPKENQKYFELKGKEKTLKNRIKHLTKKAKVLKAGGVNNSATITALKKINAKDLLLIEKIEELESEKYDKFYLNLQFFSKPEKYKKNKTLREMAKGNFDHAITFGDLNDYGIIDRKMYTKEVIVTNERALHILGRHPEIENITRKDVRNAISKPDGILLDRKNKNSYLFTKEIDEKNSLVLSIRLLDNSSSFKFGKRNTIITSFVEKTRRIRNNKDLLIYIKK